MRAINTPATGASVAHMGAGSGGSGAGAGPSDPHPGAPLLMSKTCLRGHTQGFRRSRRPAVMDQAGAGRQRRTARRVAVRRLHVQSRRRPGLRPRHPYGGGLLPAVLYVAAPAVSMEERQRRIADELAAQLAQEAAGATAAVPVKAMLPPPQAKQAAAREPTPQEISPTPTRSPARAFRTCPGDRRREPRPTRWPGMIESTAGSPTTGACFALRRGARLWWLSADLANMAVDAATADHLRWPARLLPPLALAKTQAAGRPSVQPGGGVD